MNSFDPLNQRRPRYEELDDKLGRTRRCGTAVDAFLIILATSKPTQTVAY